jgi:ribosomal protein S18 acetylase RimI-like enzyme
VTAEHVNVRLRAATAGDVDAIAALHVASWLAAYSGIVPDAFLRGVTLESRIVRWGQAVDPSVSPHTETVVAEEGGTVLGVCSFGPRRQPAGDGVGEVYALHVRPDMRRFGLGKLLLDHAVQRLTARGFVNCVLWVLRDNANARRFYEAQGWAFTGEEFVENRSGYAIPEVRYARSSDQGMLVL